jgi:hypothetical protein
VRGGCLGVERLDRAEHRVHSVLDRRLGERRDRIEGRGHAPRARIGFREAHEIGALGGRAAEVRYERICTAPDAVAAELAAVLDAPAGAIRRQLEPAHASSIGRFRRDLSADQLADVEAEAGELLAELGY